MKLSGTKRPHENDSAQLDALKSKLAEQVQTLAPKLLPNGRKDGNQWTVGDASGAKGKSFKVCLSGPKAGLVKDFAGSDKGGTLIDVYMATKGCNFKAALAGCAEMVGMPWTTATNGKEHHAVSSFDWQKCRAAVTDDQLSDFSDWRGFSPATCRRLVELNILGSFSDDRYRNRLALAVYDQHGACIGAQHFEIGVSKGLYVEGTSAQPLTIGDLKTANRVFVFESQWDAFAYLDVCGLGLDEALASTRGVPNAARLAGRIPESAEVIVFRQNDDPLSGKDGKTPDEQWFAKLLETQDRPMKSVRVPDHFKDLNDWTQAGGCATDIQAAIANAETLGVSALDALLDSRAFDETNPPPEPPAIFKIGGQTMSTPENFTMIQAKVKQGKSAVASAMLASTMEPTGDCLGFESSNPKGFAVLHFDTEQSRFHHHQVLMRALYRAGRARRPKWLYSYYLKGLTQEQLWATLRRSMERGVRECGGIHSVFLDGIGDYCADVNDPETAFKVVADIEGLAVKYQTTFVCVLHENPGSDSGKMRGHLGSHAERKAETNLRLEKDASGVTVMFSERSRTLHIPKGLGQRFQWSEEERMHVSTEAPFDAKAKPGRFASTHSKEQVLDALSVIEGMKPSLLRKQMDERHGMKKTTFYRFLEELRDKGQIVEKADAMLYLAPGVKWQSRALKTGN